MQDLQGSILVPYPVPYLFHTPFHTRAMCVCPVGPTRTHDTGMEQGMEQVWNRVWNKYDIRLRGRRFLHPPRIPPDAAAFGIEPLPHCLKYSFLFYNTHFQIETRRRRTPSTQASSILEGALIEASLCSVDPRGGPHRGFYGASTRLL